MDIDTHNELETKAGIPLDAVVTHAEMMRAFEAFKETNDQRWSTSVPAAYRSVNLRAAFGFL